MSSTASTRLRLEKQGTGDNSGTWGDHLNQKVIDLLDAAIAGVTAFTLSGPKTLTTNNYAADEARSAILHITGGSGGTVTLPNVSKAYIVRNAASGTVTFTNGGLTGVVTAGADALVWTDGTNVYATNITSTSYVDAAIAAAIDALGWETITSQAATSSMSFTSAAIADYQDLKLEIQGLSSSGTTWIVNISLYDGTNWSTARALFVSGSAFAAANAVRGSIEINNHRGDDGILTFAMGVLGSSPDVGNGGTTDTRSGIQPWFVTGGIDGIALSFSSGTADAGTLVLKGRK